MCVYVYIYIIYVCIFMCVCKCICICASVVHLTMCISLHPGVVRSWVRSPHSATKTAKKTRPSASVHSLLSFSPGDQEDLSGWWGQPTPLKNMSSSIGMIITNIWENNTCSKPLTSLFVEDDGVETSSKHLFFWGWSKKKLGP